MEQQPPSRSTPPPTPANGGIPVPPGASVSKSRAERAAPSSLGAAANSDAPVVVEVLVCPVCKEPCAEDIRYCEECGHDFETAGPIVATSAATATAAAPEERTGFSGPILWLVMVFWVVLAIGGLFFLYTALWTI
jgi:hypothetical protein